MRYGNKGDDVSRVQRMLMERGFRLPKYGADGHLGDETWEALEQYSKSELSVWDPEVPAGVIESLEDPIHIITPGPDIPDPESAVPVLDLRSEQTDPSPKSKVVNGHTVLRAPQTVTGITLHQTACTYGVSQNQIDAAGGDRQLALHRRALGVACHAMAFMDGTLVLTNPVERYIYHGNGLNSFTLGLEVEGRYPGLTNEPDKTTWGGDPTPLTGATVAAAQEGVRKLVELGRRAGMPITHIYAHRQSSETRRSDPGEGLWRHVVLDYAVPVLGLKAAQGVTVGTGEPVPEQWDPDGVGNY
tara:strand:- start:24 stop:926 length:903 start_codon:yes stop_codon:yes gene_type:complete